MLHKWIVFVRYLLFLFLFVLTCYIFILLNERILSKTIRESLLHHNGAGPWLIEVHQKQIASRISFLEKAKTGKDALGWGYLYNNLAPEVMCMEKIKVGTTDDGGKWMCSPEKLPNDCVIFALGINGVITFEDDIQRYSQNRCRIISVDSGKQNDDTIEALKHIRGVVVQAMIGAEDRNGTKTMATVLKENNVKKVEILKIDIEGAELTTMETFLNKYTVGQIMVEVHGNPKQNVEFLKMVASKGYLFSHYEINGRHHSLCEYTFIHQNSLRQYDASLLAKYL